MRWSPSRSWPSYFVKDSILLTTKAFLVRTSCTSWGQAGGATARCHPVLLLPCVRRPHCLEGGLVAFPAQSGHIALFSRDDGQVAEHTLIILSLASLYPLNVRAPKETPEDPLVATLCRELVCLTHHTLPPWVGTIQGRGINETASTLGAGHS